MHKIFSLKKIIILGLILSFLILLILTQIYESDDFEPTFKFNSIYSNKKVVSQECDQNSSITYYYYDSEPIPFKTNNKFGLYIYAENKEFFDLAEKLVNSNGGDWGYVLIPYNVKDRDYAKWNRVFTWTNEKHLIPIIQLHDIDTEDYKKQTNEASEFLNNFIWPIRQRFVSVYNEPNDAKFWYDFVNPKEYAQILDYTIDSFKKQNTDFFMLNGAFNVSASTGGGYLDSFEYMRQMDEEVDGIFSKLDGWASHSYPQPNFSGSPYNTGRWSIRAYQNEMEFLSTEFGVDKNLPVFITETGWAHAEGENYNSSYYDVDTISDYFKIAYEEIWLKDPQVVAVTPFTVKYDPPFDHFSWVNSDNVAYLHYDKVKSLKKVGGKPQALKEHSINSSKCPQND